MELNSSGFWAGYKRKPDVHSRLITAVREAMLVWPEQRLGQLISNAIGDRDLFNLYDEDLAEILHQYARSRRQ